MSSDDARAALEQVERSRRSVAGEVGLPDWYWRGLAAGWIALGVLTDLHHPWLTAATTLAFGAVHAAVAHAVLGGRRRTSLLSVHTDIAGHSTPAIVVAVLLALAAFTTAGAWAAATDGARHPVTTMSILVATIVLLGGPRLSAALQRRSTRVAHTA